MEELELCGTFWQELQTLEELGQEEYGGSGDEPKDSSKHCKIKRKSSQKDNRFPLYNLKRVEEWVYASQHKNTDKEKKKVYWILCGIQNHLLNIIQQKPNALCKCPHCVAYAETLKSSCLNMGFDVVVSPRFSADVHPMYPAQFGPNHLG